MTISSCRKKSFVGIKILLVAVNYAFVLAHPLTHPILSSTLCAQVFVEEIGPPLHIKRLLLCFLTIL